MLEAVVVKMIPRVVANPTLWPVVVVAGGIAIAHDYCKQKKEEKQHDEGK